MTQTNENPLLKQALEYHKAGINVVPAFYKGKYPPKGGEWKKYETERVSIEQLHEWFDGKWQNISAITGTISGGLTVVDFDLEKAYRWWAERNPDLAAELPTSKSGRGYHVFFRSELTKDDTSSFDKIDIKAKGLTSLPPSMHKSSVRYEWIIPLPANVSELPLFNPYDWKLEEFTDGKDGNDSNEGLDGNEGVVKKFEELGFSCFSDETRTQVLKAIEETLPKKYGERYNLLFLFARKLKKIDEIKDKSAEEIMFIADSWHERALPNIETKSIAMTQIRFQNAWEDAKYPPGDGKSLEIAKKEAFNSTMPMLEVEKFKGDKIMEKIIRLSLSLQKLAGIGNEWFIPTNKAKELFGISHSWLAVMLEKLEEQKIIKKTREHTKFRCSRYIFTGSSAELLKKVENN